MIVLFSIMRSGTSLMTRILADNPEICGFGEAHVRYRKPGDLLDLKYWISRFTYRYPRQDMYLLDKVLHARHVPDLKLLMEITDFHPVFMTREPVGNVRSLQKMFARENGSAALPWAYLLKRYAQLEEHLGVLRDGNPIAVLSYEALTQNPETVLAGLSDHLGLSHPLRAQYTVPSHVGRWGLGDGSKNILAGAIVPRKERAAPEVSEEVPLDVAEAYLALRRHLQEAAAWSCL